MSQKTFRLKNYMEDIVFMFMDELLNEKDICKCEKCRMDIAAITLNHLSPKYVVTEEGEVYAKTDFLSGQFRTDVIIQIINAIDKVSKNPHHKKRG
jgi:competence protein ComFB